ncbi:MAG: hypothetical protein HY343_08470 [Lentisphaerae bacterium]|nr:hypothetical protein [Lentisphaerota bacterium]
MKIQVAGKDCGAELGALIRERAAGRDPEAVADIPGDINVLRLARARTETDYLTELIRLTRYRDGVNTLDFDIPRKPGLMGLFMAGLRAFLWKLLRYQHDRIAFRQNLINYQFSSVLEFEATWFRREAEAMKSAVAELEKKVALQAESLRQLQERGR